jgi:hypothetical protein
MLTITAILAAVLAAVVYFAEKLAFAIILYLLCRWAFRRSKPLIRGLLREWLVLKGRCRLWLYALRHWWAMRALRGQLTGGATP